MRYTVRARAIDRRRFGMFGAAMALALTAAAAPAAVREDAVTVTTPDGQAEAVLFVPTGGGRHPGVILWPDLAGVRPMFRTIGRALADQGFVVLLPNTYYRSAPISATELDASDAETRKMLMTYRATATDDGIARDTIAYVAFLDRQKPVAVHRKIGAVGYDVGGSYAFRAAAALPDRVGAVVSVYGLGVATERPNSPHLLVPKTKAAYYTAQAKDDDAREPGDKTDIQAKIAEAGLAGVVEVYPANHGFANPTGRNFDQAAADKALAETIKLLKSAL